MEEQQTTQSQSSMSKYMIPAVVVVVIAAAVFAFYTTQGKKQTSATETAQQVQVTQAPQTTTAQEKKTTSPYKDGEYTVTGNYVSPGGPREVGVVITLKDGVITESKFEKKAEDPTSIKFQGEFADNYQPLVIGKNIDEVNLTKVAGSSLTPKGFNDALEKVKAEAKNS
jgi:hypothetical protein